MRVWILDLPIQKVSLSMLWNSMSDTNIDLKLFYNNNIVYNLKFYTSIDIFLFFRLYFFLPFCTSLLCDEIFNGWKLFLKLFRIKCHGECRLFFAWCCRLDFLELGVRRMILLFFISGNQSKYIHLQYFLWIISTKIANSRIDDLRVQLSLKT